MGGRTGEYENNKGVCLAMSRTGREPATLDACSMRCAANLHWPNPEQSPGAPPGLIGQGFSMLQGTPRAHARCFVAGIHGNGGRLPRLWSK